MSARSWMIVAAVVAIAAAACTKGSGSESTQPPPSNASPLSPVPTNTPTPKPVPCAAQQLSVVEGKFSSTGHTTTGEFIFTNTSRVAPCWMKGYPGLQMIDANGGNLPTHVANGSPPAPSVPQKRIVLAPAGGASFVFAYSTKAAAGQDCLTSAKVLVSPPGQTAPIAVVFGMNPCGGKVSVTPVQAT